MITSKSVAADELESRLKGRIAELEKSNIELRAKLLEYKHSEKAMRKSEEKFEYTSPQGKEYRFNTRIVPEFVDGELTSVLAISPDVTGIKETKTRLKEKLDNLEELVEDRKAHPEKVYRSLKESEKGLVEAQKIVHPGNRNWNIVTNESYWSDDIYQIFGCSPQKFETSYDTSLSYVHPEDQDYVNNAISGALDGKTYSIDHRIILASGEERIVHEQKEVIYAEEKLRTSGIDIIGDIPWGTHFCQFYQTKEDLMDVLVPYFKAGLENNEFCMWVTSQPLDVKDAKEALRIAVPDLDTYLEKGQIEIIPYTHWYVQEGSFDSERVLKGWIEKLNQALEDGYEGLRLNGNTFWLEKKDWNDFVDYEEEVDRVIGNYQMIALCTYCLEKCNSTEIVDVVINHQFALIKREGKWDQIESPKRKRAEETAIQAAKDWKYTFDAVPDLIAIIDTEYRIVRANRAMAAKLGVTPEECVGLTCYHAIHGKNEPPSFCPHRQLLKDRLEHTTEVHEDCLGGYFLVSASPLHDSEGKLIGSVHVAHDISERKQAEEALIRSENEFRTLTENSPDLIARFDRQNRHLYVNPVSVEIYDHPQEKVIGKTHSELGRDPEQIKFWEEHHEKVFATGEPETVEFEYTSPQGKKYYFNTQIVPEFVDGEVASVLAISRDITDIKEAEIRLKETLDNLEELVEDRTAQLKKAYRSLKESEKGLAEAQKIAHLGNWNWNVVPDKLYWSDEIYRIFGCTPQEFVATYDTFLSYVHPDDRENVENAVKEALNGKAYSIDHRVVLVSGEERIVHEQGKVFFDGNVPVQMMGIVQDITERKKAEKALESANAYNRSLIEASLDPLVTIGSDGKITDVNKATEMVTGYKRNELIGTDFSDYFTEPEKAREGYEHVFQEGSVLDYALEIQHRNGKTTPVLYNASVYRDENGEVIGVFAAARDITALKKVEKELEFASKYNRSLIEASLDPLLTIGPDGKITDVNEATESVTGYSRKELIETDFSSYFTEPEKAKEGYKQVFREGLVRDYALEIQHREGHITPVLYNASVYRDEEGEVIGIFAAARDVTEYKRAEKALKLANEYNRSLIEASIDPLVTIGPDGKITDVNNSTESITGYSRKELIGADFSDYFTEPEKASEGYQHVFQNGLVRNYPLEIRHRCGHITPVLYNASVYRDENGEVIGVFAAARDISELKKAEEKIQTLANVVESSNDAIITESLDGVITSWNKGAEQVYGYLAEEVLGKNMSILEPDNLKGEIKQLAEKVKQGKRVQHHETLRLKKDGTILNISVTLSPVFDVSGKLVAISNIAGDITEKKISENLLHEKQMVEVANRTKNDFLANMSHELRTPLNSIIGFSDMLYEQAYGELNKKQMRAVGNISSSGKHLLNLINGILDLSKIEANKMELNYREFDLATKLDLIRNVLYPMADKKNIDIEINMDSKLPRICADEEKFTRIMYNLVDNAIKFSYENSLVKIGARKKGNMVEITVTDTGIGIKAEDQHKLFKPFSQVNSFPSKKFQGTGLGLSLVKQIVNLHGGYVWFRSEQGEGSTFAFAIPIASKMKVLACYH